MPVNGSRAHSGQNHLNSHIDQTSSSSSNRRSISKRPKSSHGGSERTASNTTTPAGDTNIKTSVIASVSKTNLDKKLAESE